MAEFGLVIRGKMRANLAGEEMRVRGWPVTTVSRGEIIWSDGRSMRPRATASFFAAILLDPCQPDRARRRDP